jgi:molybdopterin-guanine dinucleotide biosynthesis protein A
MTRSDGPFTPLPRTELTGLVLAGGRSSRFGRDKAGLELAGRSFARRVADALAPCCTGLLLSVGDASAAEPGSWQVVADRFPGDGPLAGLEAGLAAATAGHVLAAPCDMPLLTTECLRALLAAARPGEITLAGDGANRFPTLGVYPRAVQPALAGFLRGGGRKAWDFLDIAPASWSVVHLAAFAGELRNVNTPADWEAICCHKDTKNTEESTI